MTGRGELNRLGADKGNGAAARALRGNCAATAALPRRRVPPAADPFAGPLRRGGEGAACTFPPTRGCAADKEWAWVVEGLQKVEQETSSLGLALAIEPKNRFEAYLIDRVEQALALADHVGGSCGVCVDTFHLALEEADPLEAIAMARPRSMTARR